MRAIFVVASIAAATASRELRFVGVIAVSRYADSVEAARITRVQATRVAEKGRIDRRLNRSQSLMASRIEGRLHQRLGQRHRCAGPGFIGDGLWTRGFVIRFAR